ncbi:tRNA lysidine(34) synthetase TilS [Alteromonas sp. ASW11-36]|uniref:tRNA(Ile)-lysidine synthase n=1 Tax=Alteromonas arenosi TaxID=3055817 RepID=A0ABT7SVI1_9ALTE|nr:tRNA lysidine(34) synthetase TilS [Alteromonas sp. ASW11-36]MDM7860199.1 tRNA lysidine(34) synthetase TilS [Alteromonas sp. ASW11-36]
MNDACEAVNANSKPSHSANRIIWVGCSGGLDSVVLLQLANRWATDNDYRIGVIHVNHQLSSNAQAWQYHVENLARQFGAECKTITVDIQKAPRKSLEALAREARYNAFEQQLPPNALLLLGHHLDDQVETAMLRLFRGSGPKGLGAMESVSFRHIGERSLIIARPLLSISRASIQDYAVKQNLTWVDDESNRDLSFDRNKMRHTLLPAIEQQWPEKYAGIKSAIARSSELCREQQQALELLLDEKLQNLLIAPAILDSHGLLQTSKELHASLLRHWLAKQGAQMPSHAVLQQLILAVQADRQAHPVVTWHNHQVRGFQQQLYFFMQPYVAPSDASYCSGEVSLDWIDAGGNAVTYTLKGTTSLKQKVQLQKECSVLQYELPVHAHKYHLARADGEQYFAARPQQKARQLKHWLKEWRIPVWHRQAMIGVFAGDELLWVTDGQQGWANYAHSENRETP